MTPDTSVPILVVDDEPPITKLLKRTLERGGYASVTTASSVGEARALLESGDYHLLLTDVQMPGGSGLDLLEDVRAEHPTLATMMVTGKDEPHLVNRALDLGAYGYVVKPFRHTEVLISVNNALRRRSLEIENRRHRDHLEDVVKERTSDLWDAIQRVEHSERDVRASRSETIRRLATAAEYRDEDTGHHLARMSHYCSLLAEAAGLGPDRCEMVREASQMHDIGKIGIPDKILFKPRSLTPEERSVMETHPTIGYQILSDSEAPVLRLAATIAHTHHEWFDGSGYPLGLRGEDIPIEGRIAAIADVFDALTTHRVYRRAFPVMGAIEMMKAEAGSHFDPDLLSTFWNVLPEIIATQERFAAADQLSPSR